MPIDWFTVVAQILNFIVLVWILRRFLYRPILKTMGERQARIHETMADANAEKTKAQEEREALEKEHTDIAHKRAEILQQAGTEAAAERERLLVEARGEFDTARRQYQETLEREKEGFQKSLSQRARSEVIAIADRLLNDLADSDLQDRMARKFVQRLTDLSVEDKARMRGAVAESVNRKPSLRSAFELDADTRGSIADAVGAWLGEVSIQFEIEPSLVCGIELAVDGQKVAWSIEDYMRSMQSCVDDLLKKSAGQPATSTPSPVNAASK